MLQPEIGVNFSTIKDVPLSTGEETKSRTGFVGGLGVLFGLSERVSIGTGGYYSQQGAKFTESGSPDITLKLDYIQVPLTLGIAFPTGGTVTPSIFAGPMIGFKASCKFTDGTETVDCDHPDVDTFVKSTDFGLLFGGGIGIQAGTGQIILNGWYNLGLTKIDDHPTDQSDAKNSFFGFGVGYAFPLGGGGM
jgi:opacity protein-like surface antigen